MVKFVDILIENRKRKEKYFKNYLKYARMIKKVAKEFLGEAKVILFGSILRKGEVPRDVDILVVSSKLKNDKMKFQLKKKVERKIGESHPFEFHFIAPEDYENWYQHFIKEEKIEV